MKPEAWNQALQPALADRKGWALFISTPAGRNWFWELFQFGQGRFEDWKSWLRRRGPGAGQVLLVYLLEDSSPQPR